MRHLDIPIQSKTNSMLYGNIVSLKRDGSSGGILPITKNLITFGRKEGSDVLISIDTCSRDHAVLKFTSKGDAFIQNLSQKGVLINNKEIKGKSESFPLSHNDIISIEGRDFRFLATTSSNISISSSVLPPIIKKVPRLSSENLPIIQLKNERSKSLAAPLKVKEITLDSNAMENDKENNKGKANNGKANNIIARIGDLKEKINEKENNKEKENSNEKESKEFHGKESKTIGFEKAFMQVDHLKAEFTRMTLAFQKDYERRVSDWNKEKIEFIKESEKKFENLETEIQLLKRENARQSVLIRSLEKDLKNIAFAVDKDYQKIAEEVEICKHTMEEKESESRKEIDYIKSSLISMQNEQQKKEQENQIKQEKNEKEIKEEGGEREEEKEKKGKEENQVKEEKNEKEIEIKGENKGEGGGKGKVIKEEEKNKETDNNIVESSNKIVIEKEEIITTIKPNKKYNKAERFFRKLFNIK